MNQIVPTVSPLYNPHARLQAYRFLEKQISTQKPGQLTPKEAAIYMTSLRSSGAFPPAGAYTDAELINYFKNWSRTA